MLSGYILTIGAYTVTTMGVQRMRRPITTHIFRPKGAWVNISQLFKTMSPALSVLLALLLQYDLSTLRFYGCLYHLKIKITLGAYHFLLNLLFKKQQAFISLIYQFWRVANDQSELTLFVFYAKIPQ